MHVIAMVTVSVAVVVEAWQKRPTPMASSAPSASNCSVRRQDCKKCRRYQIQWALPKSSGLSSKDTWAACRKLGSILSSPRKTGREKGCSKRFVGEGGDFFLASARRKKRQKAWQLPVWRSGHLWILWCRCCLWCSTWNDLPKGTHRNSRAGAGSKQAGLLWAKKEQPYLENANKLDSNR